MKSESQASEGCALLVTAALFAGRLAEASHLARVRGEVPDLAEAGWWGC